MKKIILIFFIFLLATVVCALICLPFRARIQKTVTQFLEERAAASKEAALRRLLEQPSEEWYFSNPQQEHYYVEVLDNHRGWMWCLEQAFSIPQAVGAPGAAKCYQDFYDVTKLDIPREMREAGVLFFGKEFVALLEQYHQDRMDSITKFIEKDFDGATSSLRKAKKNADRLKKIHIQNRGCLPALFADKMSVAASICMGAVTCMGENLEAGMAALRSAYDEAARVNWRYGKAQSSYFMALYARQANAPYARALYEQALRVAQQNQSPNIVWKCLEQLAQINMEQGHFEAAITCLQEAVVVIEVMRTKLQEDMAKTSFMGDKFPVYRQLTRALLEKGEIQQALEVSENVKSRVLQDLLDSHIQTTFWQSETYFLASKELALAERIEDLECLGEKGAEKLLSALREEREKLLAQIRQKDPEFGLLKVGVSVDVPEIQSLLDERTVLLEYNVMSESLRAWLVTKKSIRSERIPLNEKELMDKVQALRMMITKPKLPAAYKLLGQLYASIVQPFEKDIRGKNLILVPDGVLHYVPFAALVDGKGKFLVENHAIGVVPSFTVLKFCMAKKKGAAKTILAFGNPDLNDPKLDLPNAEVEVRNIAARFPQTKMYLRKEASESAAKTDMGKFDILHFACHGEMNQGDGMLSCLRLAPDKENDGTLTAREIFDLKLNAQMVVLSGCETGRSSVGGADEMIGMMRGFLNAGTPCMVVSHWKVDDDATSLLMTSFYKNLATMGKAEALRQAQIETMKVKKHPYYWAAFYLVGDGR